MAICPHCQRDVGGAKFCPTDGTPVAHLDHPGAGRELTAGDLVDERYRIVAELGRGGMGIVYLAQSAALGEVAVKVLSPTSAMRQTTVARFAREARLASRMDHPHLVRVYEFGFDPAGYYFLVMEVLEGRSLYSLMHEEAPLAPGRALRILSQIASALARAHGLGVVHRDMKAENVMIRPLDGEHVTVMDFGLSRTEASWGGALMTSEGQLVGTPTYMAPEQWRGEVAGPAADIYAFGVLAYELLCGHPPFPGTNVVELMRAHTGREVPRLSLQRTRGAVGKRLETLIHHCLAKDEAERPASMEEVTDRLELEITARMATTLPAGDATPLDALPPMGRDALRSMIADLTHERALALQRTLARLEPIDPALRQQVAALAGPEASITKWIEELESVRRAQDEVERQIREREAALRGRLVEAAMGQDPESLREAEASMGAALRESDPSLDQTELRAESLRAQLDGTQHAVEGRYRELVPQLGPGGAKVAEIGARIAEVRAQLRKTIAR